MPRVTSKGQITIPREIRAALGIEPGDQIEFEEIESGYKICKKQPLSELGEDPFEKYGANAESDETGSDRMRRIRGEYPRDVNTEQAGDSDEDM